MKEKRRRTILAFVIAVCLLGISFLESKQEPTPAFISVNTTDYADTALAMDALNQLTVKGRAPKTGYDREKFGKGWAETDNCDTRNIILARDLQPHSIEPDGCAVAFGTLLDPYTAETIEFRRGALSGRVQIDHVVALSDAWQKGAQSLSETDRIRLANDGLNLLAVEGKANQQKGDGDAATWLPANKPYRCQYIARQIAVKKKYKIWVTQAESDAMRRILNNCPGQKLPSEAQK